ncbi:DUF222 domain-containing protein [Gordonia sp. DT30]|uniref:HNH endonuclease signature motif containing protein n=1 Tax=Gordonia sp. DT30 TaxID=3416546 RepID=UPI003CE82D04
MIDATTPSASRSAELSADLFAGLIAQLDDRTFRADIGSRDAFAAMQQLITLRNMIDHLAATLTGEFDRLKMTAPQGRSVRQLLITMGIAPAVAGRLVRVGTATDVDGVRIHTVDGAISLDHADAIVLGLTHIESRAGEPVTPEQRRDHTRALVSQALSGMSPAEIGKHARQLGNTLADDTSGTPAAEDRSLNSVTLAKTSDGRLDMRADLDMSVGEKLCTTLETLSAPTPQPDGSHDPRTVQQRQADALETLLEAAARGLADDTVSTTSRYDVLLTLNAEQSDQSALQYMGPVTDQLATTLTCDAQLTVAILDDERAPLQLGRRKRLFTNAQRKAFILRDECCIKCGAPASRTQAHHLRHWADGGATDLDNGCLLCTACHHDVHDRAGAGSEASGPNDYWDVVMGFDRHPWLIPPSTVDPRRRPQPAYNRRTLRLDSAA